MTIDRDIAYKADLIRKAERIGFTYDSFLVIFFTNAAGESDTDDVAVHFRGGSIRGSRRAVAELVTMATSPDDLEHICHERSLFRESKYSAI